MKKRFQRAEPLAVVVVIAAFYGVLHLIGVNCPIRFLTGISCPGCGMTRAWISLLQGNLSAAVSYHPLLFTVVPTVIAVFFRSRIPKRIFAILLALAMLLSVTAVFAEAEEPAAEPETAVEMTPVPDTLLVTVSGREIRENNEKLQ